jgi:hypothetical protein
MKPRKIGLVHDWREAPKWMSTRFMVLELAWLSVWGNFREPIEATIGHPVAMGVGAAIAVLAIVGRILSVDPKRDEA